MRRIKVSKKEDRLTLVQILADNGYTVRIEQERKEGSKIYTYYVAYQESDDNNG